MTWSVLRGTGSTAWLKIAFPIDQSLAYGKHLRNITMLSSCLPTVIVRLGGMAYTDVVHVYAVARAGYIPQLFSLRLPNPDVIYELMEKADAKALIFDTSSNCSFAGASVPTYPAISHDETPLVRDSKLPSITENLSGDDIFCIFHTSGSTSGTPKIIPCSYAWLDNIITKADFLCRRRNPARQDVTTWVYVLSSTMI